MLARFQRTCRVVSPAVLCAFLATTVAWPATATAQQPAGKAAKVLFVPVQRSDDVPEGVPGRIEEYFKALVEIDPKVRVIALPRDEVSPAPAPVVAVAPEPAMAADPVPPNPAIERAAKLGTSGREAIQARRIDRGLQTLMQASGMFEKNLGDLEDFELYADVLLWIAVGLVEGGYAEEAGGALNKLVTLRPQVAPTGAEFGSRFPKALDAAKARVRTGGRLTVRATPEDAAVYVDGRLAGQGTAAVDGLPRGRHFVRVVADGMVPQSRFVTTGDKETSADFGLKPRAVKAEKAVAKRAEPDTDRPITWYARTGEYMGGKFQSVARKAAEKWMAEYVLMLYLARSESAFQLGLFLFDAQSGELASVEPAIIDTDLGNLQIALLDLESRLSTAVTAFPKDRLVRAKPAIYSLVASRPRPAPVPVAVVPVPAPAPAPAPAPVPAYVARAPAPAPAPVALPGPSATPGPSGGFDDIPADFPIDMGAGTGGSRAGKPWYKQWWVWTIVGGVVVAGAATATAVVLTRGGSSGDRFSGAVTW